MFCWRMSKTIPPYNYIYSHVLVFLKNFQVAFHWYGMCKITSKILVFTCVFYKHASSKDPIESWSHNEREEFCFIRVIKLLRGLYKRLIYMLREGLANKQDLFVLIASLALRRVSFYFISLYLIITTHCTYMQGVEWVGTKNWSWCSKQSLAKTDSNTKIQRFYLLWMT